MKLDHAFLILSAMATVMHGVQGDKQPSASLRGRKRKLEFRDDINVYTGDYEETIGLPTTGQYILYGDADRPIRIAV